MCEEISQATPFPKDIQLNFCSGYIWVYILSILSVFVKFVIITHYVEEIVLLTEKNPTYIQKGRVKIKLLHCVVA